MRPLRSGSRQIVQLTAKGEAVFGQVFPAHLVHIGNAFMGVDPGELQQTQDMLKRLGSVFKRASETSR